MMGFGWIILLAIIAALYLIFKNNRTPGEHFRSEAPLDILKKRFASGEITKEEFEERKKVL